MRNVLSHVFGDWVVVEESTKQVHGKEARECGKCGYVEFQELPLVEGMGIGPIIAIVWGTTVVIAASRISIFWFGSQKRKFSDLK